MSVVLAFLYESAINFHTLKLFLASITLIAIYRVCQKKKDILNIYIKSQIINIFF